MVNVCSVLPIDTECNLISLHRVRSPFSSLNVVIVQVEVILQVPKSCAVSARKERKYEGTGRTKRQLSKAKLTCRYGT
jgi:hypothetical protein